MKNRSGATVAVARQRKTFGKTSALLGVDLTVPAETMFGLLGPNGAGKTTIVRVLATLLLPDSGSAHIAGYAVVPMNCWSSSIWWMRGTESSSNILAACDGGSISPPA